MMGILERYKNILDKAWILTPNTTNVWEAEMWFQFFIQLLDTKVNFGNFTPESWNLKSEILAVAGL